MMDDVEIAVSQLTELGRRVVAPSASVIRNTMLMFAAANHWPVIVHSEFAKWALDQAKSDEICLILDPLMYVDGAKARLKRIRRSRILTSYGMSMLSETPGDVALVAGRSVLVIDDAVLTGGTLTRLEEEIRQYRGSLAKCVVGVATKFGTRAVSGLKPHLIFQQFLVGDNVPIHIRDGCPLIPHSGRRVHDLPVLPTLNGSVTLSRPATAFRGGPWEQLGAYKPFQAAVRWGKQHLIDALAIEVGRQPTVSDIPLIGNAVAATMMPGGLVTEHTTLASLFGVPD